MIDKTQLSPPQGTRSLPSSPVQSDGRSEGTGDDFTTVLAGFTRQTVETMRDGEQAGVAGIKGQAPIQEVVDKVMAAEHALQSALAVRDKVVSAWIEISRMTI